MGQQGKRTDLQEIADLVINGGMINVMQHRPDAIIKYPKGLEKLVELTMTERKTKPKVVWVWGDAGVGKTRLAVEGAESHYVWSGLNGGMGIPNNRGLSWMISRMIQRTKTDFDIFYEFSIDIRVKLKPRVV